MVPPILTLLVASSLQLSADAPRPVDLGQIALSITQALETVRPRTDPAAAALTLRDIPFHYDLLAPVPVPAFVPRVTYDWRSPVIFDLP